MVVDHDIGGSGSRPNSLPSVNDLVCVIIGIPLCLCSVCEGHVTESYVNSIYVDRVSARGDIYIRL